LSKENDKAIAETAMTKEEKFTIELFEEHVRLLKSERTLSGQIFEARLKAVKTSGARQ